MKIISSILVLSMFISCNSLNDRAESKYLNQIDSLHNELKKSSNIIKTLQQELALNKTDKYSNENFIRFFTNFMSDSTFQVSRIRFPIKNVTWLDDPGDAIDTLIITKSEWKYESFYINTAFERTQIYDNFDLKFQATNERVLHWYGVETGGDAKYFFKGFYGKWYLVRMENLGD
ncbi:DUF4348 domain-containing protein [Marinifilum flexuosum]|uniref:DUF4348 domain-containing protein n=1 Tax=Marinifilum flexuosum TaxID=1117708 RepID=UPI0024932C21|nr:DUF4348 domain-containing protein [Marinifilum flexuosum]